VQILMQFFLLRFGARVAVARDGRSIGRGLLGDGIGGISVYVAVQIDRNCF